MSLPVDPFTFATGGTADALQVNARFAQLYAALSAGGLDPTVFAAGALGSREVGLDIVGVDAAATFQVLTASLADITGASFTVTPSTDSKLLIAARVGLQVVAMSGNLAEASVSIALDGASAIGLGKVGAAWPAGSTTIAPAVGFGVLSLSAAAHTIKLQASSTGSAGASQVTGRSQMFGILVAA